MKNIFEEIKNQTFIRAIIERYHGPSNKNNKWLCPFHDEKTPSFCINEKGNFFNCFGCNTGGDGIKFVEKMFMISPIEAAKMIIQDFGLNIKFDQAFEQSPQGKLRAYLKECQQYLYETNYFTKRGLSDETQRTHCLGFDAKKKMVTIPYSSNFDYYIGRNITDKRFFKPKADEVGQEPIWNARVLWKSGKDAIFVTESPICAMSISQYGGQAIAIGGTGANKLIEHVKMSRPKGTFILCLDNDEAGRKATETITTELKKLNLKFIVYNIAGECKDPNELLLKDCDELVRNIRQAENKAFYISRERTDMISMSKLVSLPIPPKQWLIKDFLPNGLGMLVAASKVGKSWMSQQMTIAVANGQTFLGLPCEKADVLYYALEDTDERLQYRIKTMLQDNSTPDNAYILLECNRLDNGLLDDLERRIKENQIKFVIFDTFQMIRGHRMPNEKDYAYDNRELSVLRKFAHKHDVAILVVHHSRKQVDDNDVFNMTTGSTGLMGAVDNMYFIRKEARMTRNASTLSITGRDVLDTEMRILRDRSTCMWYVAEKTEERDQRIEEEEYITNPIVKAVKHLLKHSTFWEGTIGEFVYVAKGIIGDDPFKSLAQWGLEIIKVIDQLKYRDNITYTKRRRSSGQVYLFEKKPEAPLDIFRDETKIESRRRQKI